MATSTCTICGKDTENKCGRCKSAIYCSGDCQKKDFPLHKLLCKTFAAFSEVGPTIDTEGDEYAESSAYKLAILFPEQADSPELIWVKCLTKSEYDEEYEDEPENPLYHHYQTIHESLGKHVRSPQSTSFSRHGQEIETYIGDNAIGECAPNQCFGFLNAGYKELDLSAFSIGVSRFAGNLVTVRCEVKEINNPVLGEVRKVYYQDITLTDLRHAFEFMACYNTIFESKKPNPYYFRNPRDWMNAVKISCSGDMAFMGMPKYREVAISRHHEMFWDDNSKSRAEVADIPKQMGFPLLIKKVEVDRSWRHKINPEINFDPCNNRESVYLMHNMDLANAEKWDSVDAKKWDNGIDQTVLVARKDKKDLTTQQVEGLVKYIKDVVAEYMIREDEDNESHFDSSVRQRIVDELLLSAKFKDFFEDLKKKKIEGGDGSWADAVFFDMN